MGCHTEAMNRSSRRRPSPAVLGFLFGLVLVSGCSQRGGDAASGTTISAYTLTGVVGGQPWALGTAQTNSFLSAGRSLIFAELYWSTFTACTAGSGVIVGDEVILNLPRARGEYALGPDLNATFFVRAKNDNLIATEGRIVINSVTATSISGGADIELDTNNHVEGQFQIALCP